MFGLMRPEKKCGKSCHDWTRTHRMHYCGTCKAIGTQYGHQARLFLNFDIVFLSELLSDLNNEKMDEWTDAYQSINRCFSMPTEVDKTPFSLQYTATANTILSALKVDDNIKDQKQLRWYATRKFYARSFRKAFEQMEAWGTPKEAFFHWIDLQIEREENIPKEQDDLFDYLMFYAEPTAELTALIFEEGVKKIKPSHQQSFRTLGYNFGLLMYILDAFEDLENDIFTKQFNPLIHWFDANKTLKQDQLADVRHIILQLQHKVCEGFKELPLKQKTTYSARLVSNIALRIYRERYIPTTRKERIQFRWDKAKEFAEQIICSQESNYSMVKYYLVTSSIFLMPRLANEMPKRADKIDWEWSAFWSMVLPFSIHSNTAPNTNQTPPQEEEEEDKKNKIIACCCCFSSLSVFPISQCGVSSNVSPPTPTGGGACCSGQGGSNNCPAPQNDCCCNDSGCDCGKDGGGCSGDCCCNSEKSGGGSCGGDCCCDSGSGSTGGSSCCCDGGKSGGGGDCCCNSGKGGGSGGNNGGGSDNGNGSSGGSNGGSSGGNDGGGSGGESGGGSGGSDGGDCCAGGGDCCSGKGGGGGSGSGDCCCGGKGSGGGGGGGDCCGGKGGGSGGGGDCCCGGKGGGGGGGGCDCCKVDAGGFDLSAPAHFESCNGVLECFFPWHC
jgi:hypothetical protein